MGKMDPKIAAARKAAKFAELMNAADKLLGEDTPGITGEEVLQKLTSSVDNGEDLALEAEATLLYFNLRGKGFTHLECPVCEKKFAVKYSIPGHKMKCSNTCRAQALAEIGIKWNPHKSPEERWGISGAERGIMPLIVPPPALAILEQKLQEPLYP